jgi:hypothetical protein
MSERVQRDSRGRGRTEVFAFGANSRDWILRLIAALAGYPTNASARIAPFDTMPLEKPRRVGNSLYVGLLLAWPDARKPWFDFAIEGVFPEPIILLQAVLLHRNELDLAIHKGGKTVWKKIHSRQPLCVDAERT